MRKIAANLLTAGTAIAVVAGMVFMAGCNFGQPEAKIIAQQSGMYTAVSWIATDNPSRAQIEALESVLPTVTNLVTTVGENTTYTAVIYPEAVKYIDKNLEIQYRPLAKAGTGSILGAIDIMFALHPEWKQDKDQAVELVAVFVAGARQGLALHDTHPAVVSARKTGALRSNALN